MPKEFKAFIKGKPVKMIKDPKTGQEKWVPIIEEAESEEFLHVVFPRFPDDADRSVSSS